MLRWMMDGLEVVGSPENIPTTVKSVHLHVTDPAPASATVISFDAHQLYGLIPTRQYTYITFTAVPGLLPRVVSASSMSCWAIAHAVEFGSMGPRSCSSGC